MGDEEERADDQRSRRAFAGVALAMVGGMLALVFVVPIFIPSYRPDTTLVIGVATILTGAAAAALGINALERR